MHRRSLLACTAVVLIAHAALIEVLTRPGVGPQIAPASVGHGAARMVILDRATVAALAPTTAGGLPGLPPAASAPPPETGAESANADRPTAPTKARDEAASPSPGAGLPLYRSAAELDVAPRPRSAPDVTMLDGLPWSGLPIRLRLFIDGQGTVVEAQALQSEEAVEVIDRVRQMFLATGFTPGLIHGEPVPSYKDIEIVVGIPH